MDKLVCSNFKLIKSNVLGVQHFRKIIKGGVRKQIGEISSFWLCSKFCTV